MHCARLKLDGKSEKLRDKSLHTSRRNKNTALEGNQKELQREGRSKGNWKGKAEGDKSGRETRLDMRENAITLKLEILFSSVKPYSVEIKFVEMKIKNIRMNLSQHLLQMCNLAFRKKLWNRKKFFTQKHFKRFYHF